MFDSKLNIFSAKENFAQLKNDLTFHSGEDLDHSTNNDSPTG